MKNPKLVGILVIAVLILIVILQNMESVSTKILFVTITMPRAALLFIALAIGFIAGLVVAATTRRGDRPSIGGDT